MRDSGPRANGQRVLLLARGGGMIGGPGRPMSGGNGSVARDWTLRMIGEGQTVNS